jgi:sensor domain CHASE-containing protein
MAMTLRTKTTLIVSSSFLALIALLLVAALIVVLGRFRRLEKDEAQRDAQRAYEALNVQITNLTTTTADWSHWDETAEFVQGRMPQFVEANLMDETYLTLRLDVIAFIGPDGRVVYQRWFDRSALATAEPLPGFAAVIPPGAPLVSHSDVKSHREGLLVLPDAMLLVASQPVTDSLYDSPAVGTMVFGRIIDKAEMELISDIVHLDTHLAALDDPSLEPDERKALARSGAESTAFVITRGQDRITSLLRLNDVTGDAAAALIVNASRPIFAEGVLSI